MKHFAEEKKDPEKEDFKIKNNNQKEQEEG